MKKNNNTSLWRQIIAVVFLLIAVIFWKWFDSELVVCISSGAVFVILAWITIRFSLKRKKDSDYLSNMFCLSFACLISLFVFLIQVWDILKK